MTNRVVLGKRGAGDFGLYISQPGINVLTAGINQMLFHPNQRSLQFVQTGRVTINSGNPVNITVPNLGYWPMLLLSPDDTYGDFPEFVSNDWEYVRITYNSNTSITIAPTGSATAPIVYVVLRLRADG